VREAILPTVEALIPLRVQGRPVTGGYLVGEGQMVFVFEADSEEEVREVLEELPLSGVAPAKVRRMRALGEMRIIGGPRASRAWRCSPASVPITVRAKFTEKPFRALRWNRARRKGHPGRAHHCYRTLPGPKTIHQ